MERFNRFLADRLNAGLPGNRGGNTQERPIAADEIVARTRAAIKEKKPLGYEHGTCLTRAEFEDVLDAFVRWHNSRPQSKTSQIAGRSPLQVWEEEAGERRRAAPAAMWFLFHRVERKRVDQQPRVDRMRVALFAGAEYTHECFAAPGVAGEFVDLRYDPDDLSYCLVFNKKSGELICAARRVPTFDAFDAAQTEAANKLLAKEKKLYKKQMKQGVDAARKLQEFDLYESIGIDPTKPAGPDHAGVPIAPVRTGFERIGKEAMEAVEQLRHAVNETPRGEVETTAASRRLLRKMAAVIDDEGDEKPALILRGSDFFNEDEEG